MRKVLLSTVVVASLFAAQNYEVGAGIGYSDIEKSNKLDNKTDVNLRIGKYLPKHHIVRLELETSVDGSGPNLTKALVNVEHYFGNKKIQPYAFLGAGYQWAEGSYPDNFIADLGLGAKYKINEKWAAFLEARALRDFGNNDNHYSAILGVNYKFGVTPQDSDKDGVSNNMDKCANTPAGVAVDANGCAVDGDGDGIPDYLDKCPNTPMGVKVGSNGCALDNDHDGVPNYLDKCANTPAGVKVGSNGCALDSDHDGVADYLDKCANTPAGVKVGSNGCALDSDHDGVANYLDKCANTPAGVKVNKNGCALSYTFKITFANNSAKLNADAQIKVKAFSKFLMKNKNVNAEIEGYTDNKGSKAYNIELSAKRAKAVYTALINDGISAKRLSYKGFGPANPIAPNTTKEGMLKNRRVVAKLIYK